MKNEGKNLCFSTPGFVFYYQTFCSLVLSIKFVTQLFFYIFFCFLFFETEDSNSTIKIVPNYLFTLYISLFRKYCSKLYITYLLF